MPKLIFDGDETGSRVYPLVLEQTTVGRSEQNALTIPHPSVSSFHCELRAWWRELIVRDLNSSNGTFVNGECLRARQRPVKHGDVLGFGEVKARVDMSDVPADDEKTDVTAVHEHDRYKRRRQEHSEKTADQEHATLQLDDDAPSSHQDHTLILSLPPESTPLPVAGDEVSPPAVPRRRFPANCWIVAVLLAGVVVAALWFTFRAG